jgi:hypothetical protein
MRRLIKLISIKDEHTYEVLDTGYDRDGQTTSNRSALMRRLSKRTGDDAKALPVFRVVEVGPWMQGEGPYERPVPDAAVPNPEWDDQWLYQITDTGRELKGPTKAWLAERERNMAKSAQRRSEADAMMTQKVSAEIGAGIVDLAKRLGAQQKQEVRRG